MTPGALSFKRLRLIAAIALISCSTARSFASVQICQDTSKNITGSTGKSNEPLTTATQGFFLDDWHPKRFIEPKAEIPVLPRTEEGIVATIDFAQVITKVSAKIFGNNTNPYMGPYINDSVLMNHLKELQPNVLRFPGGSLADLYFWNIRNDTPPEDVPGKLQDSKGKAVKATYCYGNSRGPEAFTVDNFYEVLEQTNSTGLITVNYGYARYGQSDHPVQAAAHLAADWVRYDKGRTNYWEIGNENWGNWEAGYQIGRNKNKGVQPEILTGIIYGNHFKVFADSMRKAAREVGNKNLKIGMVLTEVDERRNPTVIIPNWNNDALRSAGETADFYAIHNYYTPYLKNSTPAEIFKTASEMTLLTVDWVKHSLKEARLTEKPIALDEWNIFATGSRQMVSNVSGLHALMVVGELLKNKLSLAARWDLANGWDNGNDHGLLNRGDEPGADKWNPRPAYFYLYYFQKYFGDRMINSGISGSGDIVSYASSFSSGHAGVILANTDTADHVVTITLKNFVPGNKYYYYTLKGDTDNKPFSGMLYVNNIGPAKFSGGPADLIEILPYSSRANLGIQVCVPSLGAVFLVIQPKLL